MTPGESLGADLTKVFLVTAGEYSDYHIEAVFSTRELAEKYIAAVDDGTGGSYDDHRDIEEYCLDSNVPTALQRWSVRISRAGTVLEAARSGFEIGDLVDRDGNLYLTMWADDEQHAIKIANERRTAWILRTTPEEAQ